MAGEDSTIDLKPLLSITILCFLCFPVSYQRHTSDSILVCHCLSLSITFPEQISYQRSDGKYHAVEQK